MRTQRKVNRPWFNKVKKEFSRVAKPFAGKPINYLEIGVWRGDSAQWVQDHILTHPDARGIGIDPYLPGHNYGQDIADDAYQQARSRLTYPKFDIVRQKSQEALLYFNAFARLDLVYLDGAHDAHSVVLDFCYVWRMLKTGSVVIFDDYAIGLRKGPYHVRDGVHAIMGAFGRWVEKISEGYQYAIRVNEMPPLGEICR